jgi:hypothetical protein
VNTDTRECITDTDTGNTDTGKAALIAKGKAIFESNKYAPKGPPMDLGPWGP